MNIEIIAKEFHLNLFGFSTVALNNDYVGTVFKLSGKVWEVAKTNSIKNKGKNIWVYEDANKVFAGLEPENFIDDKSYELEKKEIVLKKYAYYKHIGSYSLIKQAGQNMKDQLNKQGFEITLPYIEIYGHWSNDKTKLETELFMCLK